MRVLVIDDDRELCELIRDYLGPLGYETVAEHDGVAGAERAAERFDAVILDVMLPAWTASRCSGASAEPPMSRCSCSRRRGEETDRIVGLEMGADDYLPKTFSSRELLARLRAVTRRSTARPPAAGSGADWRDGQPPGRAAGGARGAGNRRRAAADQPVRAGGGPWVTWP